MSADPLPVDERREQLVRRIDAQQRELVRAVDDLGDAVKDYANPGQLIGRSPYAALAVAFALGLVRGYRRSSNGSDGYHD
jgi:hypothetical protein